jgi:hypothetical protein
MLLDAVPEIDPDRSLAVRLAAPPPVRNGVPANGSSIERT